MSVQSLEPKFYAILLEKLGLSDDPDFARQFDKALWPTLTDRLRGVFASKTRDAWAAHFEGSDACVAPVLNPEEAMAHPMNTARCTWYEVNGTLQAAAAPRFAGKAARLPATPPARGQHTDEILSELK